MTVRVAILVLLALAFGAYGQLGCLGIVGANFDDAHLCGKRGTECCGLDECDDGLACINGACLGCGGPNEPCCSDGCDPGVACFAPAAEQAPTCTTSCGIVGMSCCDGTCPDGGVCVAGSCVSTGIDPDPCSGSESHFVYILDGSGCTTEKKEFWADPGNVQACADAQLAGYPPDFTVGPADNAETCEWVCQYLAAQPDELTDSAPVWVCALSEQGLDACKLSQCADCFYTDEQPAQCGAQF